MIDETRIERALREGPPFRTGYAQRPLSPGSTADPHGSRLLALVSVTVLMVVAIGGAALVGSGAVRLPSLIVSSTTPSPTQSPTPSATPAATIDPNESSAWVATGSMLTPRAAGHSVTLLLDGRVLVAGGGTASAELLDPLTLTWSATADMTEARTSHTATLLRDGRVLVAGGGTSYGVYSPISRTAEIYDPATGSWTRTGDMTEARRLHTATLLPGGIVLVAGATDGGYGLRSSAELFDPATGTWTPTGSMTDDRWWHTATLLPDGRVLAVGGRSGEVAAGPCCVPLSSAELYDPVSGSWTTTESMLDLRGGSTATLLPDGRVLVAGPAFVGEEHSAELYDPAAESWTVAQDMITPRSMVSATLLLDGRVLVAGGTGTSWGNTEPSYDGLNNAELYDPLDGSWTLTAPLLGPRVNQVAVRLLDGRVLLVRGASTTLQNGDATPSDPDAEVYYPAGYSAGGN